MTVKGINLIPDEVKREWRLKRLRSVFAVLAVLYLGALFLIFLNQRSTLNAKTAELKTLTLQKEQLVEKSARYVELRTKLDGIRRSESALEKRFALVGVIAAKRISWSVVLKRLSRDIPGGVWLRSLSTSGDGSEKRVRFLGTAISNMAVADFVFTLENSGYFVDVDLSYSQKRDFGSKTVFDFEIAAKLKKTIEVMYGG
jgi:Tfp pilus assembly protein PilN